MLSRVATHSPCGRKARGSKILPVAGVLTAIRSSRGESVSSSAATLRKASTSAQRPARCSLTERCTSCSELARQYWKSIPYFLRKASLTGRSLRRLGSRRPSPTFFSWPPLSASAGVRSRSLVGRDLGDGRRLRRRGTGRERQCGKRRISAADLEEYPDRHPQFLPADGTGVRKRHAVAALPDKISL